MGVAISAKWEKRLLRLRPEEWLFVILSLALVVIAIDYGAGHKTLLELIGNWRFVIIIVLMCAAIFLRGWYHHRTVRGALWMTGQTLRQFSPLWACIIIYETLHDLTPILRPDVVDEHLIAIDHFVFGTDVSRWLNDAIGSPLTTEILVIAYTSYGIATPGFAAWLFLKGRSRAFRDLSLAISLTAVIGYVGYLLVPAVGPYMYQGAQARDFGGTENIFPDQLPQWHGSPGHMMLETINGLKGEARDVFPSLHTAMTTVLLAQMWRNGRRLFWTYLPVAVCLYTATLYLRVHYAVDVAAGFATAALVLWLTPRINDWWYARSADLEHVVQDDELPDDVRVVDGDEARS